MKKFIKENWFKLVLVIIMIIFVSLYFSKTKINNISNQNLVENQIKCKNVVEADQNKNIKENIPYGANYREAQYVFNKDLNTCLYRKEYSIWNGTSRFVDDYSIIDIYSNKTISHFYQHYDKKGNVNYTEGTEEEYNNAVKKYFNE